MEEPKDGTDDAPPATTDGTDVPVVTRFEVLAGSDMPPPSAAHTYAASRLVGDMLDEVAADDDLSQEDREQIEAVRRAQQPELPPEGENPSA